MRLHIMITSRYDTQHHFVGSFILKLNTAMLIHLSLQPLLLLRLRAALTTLEDAKATLLSQERSSSKGRSRELEMLMAASKRGGPLQHVGLRGRLGDLATIDPEFDVAIRYDVILTVTYSAAQCASINVFFTALKSPAICIITVTLQYLLRYAGLHSGGHHQRWARLHKLSSRMRHWTR